MGVAARFWELLGALTPAQLAVGLSVTSVVLFLVEDRRVALLPLLAQYLVIGLIIGGRIFRPVLWLFVGFGVAVSLVLVLSAGRVQRVISASALPLDDDAEGEAASPDATLPTSGPVFNAMALILAGIGAYGVWRLYPMEGVPPELNLASYWLVANGLVLALVAQEPLRIGFGIITLLNGAISAYLLLERSLLVFALLGVMYGMVALATVVCTEGWVEAHGGSA